MKTKRLCCVKVLILFAFFFINTANLLLGQNYSKSWYMDRKTLDFSSATPTISSLPLATNVVKHVSNGVYGITNNLLFFVQDNKVLDRNGNLITTFTAGASSGMQGPEMIITQVPGSCDNYYIIYTRYEPQPGGFGIIMPVYLVYTRINMSMNSGLGGVVVQDVPLTGVFPDPSYWNSKKKVDENCLALCHMF